MRKRKSKAIGKELGINQQGRKEDIAQNLDYPTVLRGRKSRYFMPISPMRKRQRISEIN